MSRVRNLSRVQNRQTTTNLTVMMETVLEGTVVLRAVVMGTVVRGTVVDVVVGTVFM